MSLNSFGNSQAPNRAGMVVQWSGKLSNIPVGWALCDGNNGTPDLRDKFVRSVSNGSTDPGTESGGTKSRTLSSSQMASHDHNIHTDTAGGHSHYWDVDGAGADGGNTDVGVYDAGNTYDPKGTGGSGGHQHSIDTGNAGATSPSAITNMPPYYELAYIMKV